MLFNVYYLNFSKVYEIKMMLSNVIKTDKTVETSQGDTLDAELQAKMGTKFLKLFSADVGSDIKSGSSDSQKVLENFKVTMTKSLILNESESDSDNEIHNSQYPTATVVRLKSEDDGLDYTYIDLLAIVQVIKSESPDVEKGTVKAARKKDSK